MGEPVRFGLARVGKELYFSGFMPRSLSRRQFLRSAGGVTFLALVPVGRGLFGAPNIVKPLPVPLFTALPYIQPGLQSRLVLGAETVRLAWQTEPREADYVIDYGRDENYGQTTPASYTSRDYTKMDEGEKRFNYVCLFTGLDLETEYRYRVRCNGSTILEGYFTTRQPRGRRVRFAAFGDNSHGEMSDRAIAYQTYLAHPDFVMNCGDNVYDSGLDDEYGRYFFPVYNADVAGPRLGAPLLRSVPFYTIIANHDVHGKIPGTKNPCADFDTSPDSLAYYSNFYLPLNGPIAPTYPTPVIGGDAALADFQACAAERFPRMANYSYDYGDAHFICIDSNLYLDPTDPALQKWIQDDLSGTTARWKFAIWHHPPFNVGAEHYDEQHMRVLSPLLEKLGVDFVLSGHEHNYQRTLPLRFAPTDLSAAGDLNKKKRLIPGTFTLDPNFDGVTHTKPQGIIYLTTGAGGKHLYDPGYTNNPSLWLHPEDNNLPYVVKMVSDRHSLSVFDLDGPVLTMRQIDEDGNVIDRFTMTKA
jgi:acid phosphatase type 7